MSCGQAIAGDGAFAVAMLADLPGGLAEHGAWFYRRIHWEAGAIGQALYLEAESDGVHGTTTGCGRSIPTGTSRAEGRDRGAAAG